MSMVPITVYLPWIGPPEELRFRITSDDVVAFRKIFHLEPVDMIRMVGNGRSHADQGGGNINYPDCKAAILGVLKFALIDGGMDIITAEAKAREITNASLGQAGDLAVRILQAAMAA